MLDWLAKIPGQEFLAYFSLMSFVCMGVGWWLVRGSDGGYPLPDKNQLDPITFAALRGQWRDVIDVVVVQLIGRNIIGISEKLGEKTLFIKEKTLDLSPTEHVIYNYLMVPKTGSGFNGDDMRVLMESALQPVYRELEKLHLLKTEEEVSQGKRITYFMMFCLWVLAFSKIYFAMIYNKPFLLLVIVSLVLPLLMFNIVKPGDRVTRLGNNYIRAVNRHYSWLKNDLVDHQEDHSSLRDYALGAAIFGVGILAFSEIFDGYQVFAQGKRERQGNEFGDYDGSGNDGSDGGGDSGGGSSDGGGSGCGGCGGGD